MTVPRRGLRGVTGMLASALVLALAACATPLPNSVVAGSSTTIGWTHRLTSTNPASTDGATDGNLGVAALTRGHLYQCVHRSNERLNERFVLLFRSRVKVDNREQ